MIPKSIISKFQILGFALALGALGGCASSGDLASVKASADKATQMASEAQSSAAMANSAATAASQKADKAAMEAEQAASAAQSASAKADQVLQEVKEINEKLDRMFKKGMGK